MPELLSRRLTVVPRFARYGRVTRVGLVIEAAGIEAGLGELCRVTALGETVSILAEVVGFHERGVLLMPLGELDGLHPGSSVQSLGRSFGVEVGPGMLGRVLNGLGHPIDGKGRLEVAERVARLLQLQHGAPARTLQQVVLRLDGADGAEELVRIGLRADSSGTLVDSVTDIQLSFGQKTPASASTGAVLGGNLDSARPRAPSRRPASSSTTRWAPSTT